MATEQLDLEPIAAQLPMRRDTPDLMSLIDYAVKNQSAIEVIKELRAMQMFDQQRRAEREFNDALEAAQNDVSEVIPDADNEQTGKKYASFKALNAALRPVYLKHKFSLSFNASPSPNPEEIHVLCAVAHDGGCTKQYMIPMSTDNKGPKGGGVMSKQQAFAAAASYGRSVLLKLIFNIAIGATPEEETPQMEADEKRERLAHFAKCQTFGELQEHFAASYREAKRIGDVLAENQFIAAKDKRKLELKKAGAQ